MGRHESRLVERQSHRSARPLRHPPDLLRIRSSFPTKDRSNLVIKNRNMLAGSFFVFNLAGSMMLMVYYIPIYFQALKRFRAGVWDQEYPSGFVARGWEHRLRGRDGKDWVLYSIRVRLGCRHAHGSWADLDVESRHWTCRVDWVPGVVRLLTRAGDAASPTRRSDGARGVQRSPAAGFSCFDGTGFSYGFGGVGVGVVECEEK